MVTTGTNYRKQEPIAVWLVEDNNHFRKTMARLIDTTSGMRCAHAFCSCEDAIEAFQTEPPPEIVLLDIGLPGMSGVEGIEKFKSFSCSTHIVILTVHNDDANVFNAICAGASGYLLKDSPPERIIAAINEVVEGGAPMNPPIARRVLEMFARREVPKGEYGLTEREKEILEFTVNGLTKKKIAEQLFVSYHTVNTHLKNIYSKLQVHTRSGAVSKVYKENLL
jgi:DNA-binding NarL/FixJ family response regulator